MSVERPYLFENDITMYTVLAEQLLALHFIEAQKALIYAAEKHKSQTRKEGRPYIIHPLTIACSALAMGILDEDLISTILLHDVCEDCAVTVAELPANDTVKRSVELLTFERLKGENEQTAKRRYFTNIATDEIATMVKLMDRCHNISTMSQAFTISKMRKYIEESKEYVLLFLYQEATKRYPQYHHQLFLIKYHLGSVVDSVDNVLNLYSAGVKMGYLHEGKVSV